MSCSRKPFMTAMTMISVATPIMMPKSENSAMTRPDERFRLQVDRQTKRSFTTLKAAVEAGAQIKKAHPIVQVSIYDAVDAVNQMVGPDGIVEPEPEKAE